jgi:glycosyltransferase involved in cell wall biosynthesis
MDPGLRVLAAHPSPDGYGADLMLLAGVRGLRDRGLVPIVTIPDRGPLVDRLDDAHVSVELLSTPVLRKGLLRPLGLVRLLLTTGPALVGMAKLIRRVDPRVVYVNTLTIPLWFVAGRLTGRPVVCHVREAEDGVPRWLERLLTVPLLLVSRILANSEHTAARLTALWPALGSRTRVVYNGFGERCPAPPPAGPRHELLVVGRLSPRKGQHVAIEALAELVRGGHDVELRLVGTAYPGYEWYVAELESRVARLGLGDRVRFDGYRTDTAEVYASASVVLVPSLVEPFGNVAVEAQMAGRVVVASDVGGLAEIVRDGETGSLVPPDDPTALAAAVGAVLADEGLTADLTSRAARVASERFGLERYQDELAAQLADVAVGR